MMQEQSGGSSQPLTVLDQVMDQLLIQTVCNNNAMFVPNTSDDASDAESEYTYEEVEITDSGSEADGEETRQDVHSGFGSTFYYYTKHDQ